MQRRAKLGISLTVAAVVGFAGALFLAGPALFADGSNDERLAVVAILALVLGVAGFGLVYWAPVTKKIAPWLLAAPTILLSVVLAWDDRNMLITALFLVAGAIGFSLGGVRLGARIRLRRAPRPNTSQTKTP
ncbi:MAG TPA: hypothetical protein VGB18_01045 [Candidatus Thermoplasmatota archaeon]